MIRKLLAVGTVAALALALSGGVSGAAGGKTVKASGVSFTPKTARIGQGEKITWQNVSGSHTVTFRKGSYSKTISGSARVSKTFRKTGTFRYYCIPHESQGMTGKVVVGDV